MTKKALDMAIKALEQQPCEDCVSRQAVLDIIYFEDKWLYDANSHNADTKIVFSGLESRVKALPSVTPKAEWIPVSEKLPEKNGKYLVTVRNGNVYAGVYDAFSGRFQCAAIAWMPLPQPYEAEESDKE